MTASPASAARPGQPPPAHGLGPDRVLHRLGVDIQVVGAGRSQRAELAVEGGQVSRAVPEPHEVERHDLRSRIHRRGERLRREQVVPRPDPGGELGLGHHEAHHPEAAPRDLREIHVGPAQPLRHLQLRRGRQQDLDHRAEPRAVILAERVRGQHLVRAALVGHPPGQQHDHPGQAARRNFEHVEGILADRLTAGGAAAGERERGADGRRLGHLGMPASAGSGRPL